MLLPSGSPIECHEEVLSLQPNVPELYSSWDLRVRDDSDETPCISFLAREVQPATKPAEAQVEEDKGGPTIRPSTDSSNGGMEHSPLAILFAYLASHFLWRTDS